MNRPVVSKTPVARGAAAAADRVPLSDSVVRLRRILELELKRGCDNNAVIGGLDRFLSNGRADAAIAEALDRLPPLSKPYAALSSSARKRWLTDALEGKMPRKPAASKASLAKTTAPEHSTDPLDQPVTVIKGVKGATQALLSRIGVHSVRDLLYLFPNRHNDFAEVRSIAELKVGEEQTTLVNVWSATASRLGKRGGTTAVVGDESGNIRVVWFNQPYLADNLKTNDRIVLSGKVTIYNGLKTMESPEWERLDSKDLTHTGRLVPVYPTTQGLSQRILRRSVKEAVDRYAPLLKESLPGGIRSRLDLPGLVESLQQLHYPESQEKQQRAHRRVAFEELLCVQLAVQQRRQAWQEGRSPLLKPGAGLDAYRSVLPFELTHAQERVLSEIVADLQAPRPMARLLQGDVGSGKTAVAAAGLLIANANTYQGALMAPTEILAEQHYRTLTSLLGRLEVDGRRLRIELLVGSQTPATKRSLAEAVASGAVDILVGTHALIQEGVSFHKLGLAVVDEQHRFGVMQRAALRERIGDGMLTPHLLVMSATPIPRTLALTFYGDLDVSVIDQLPPGRQPIETRWVSPEDRSSAYGFVRDQVRQGRQAFVVCPLIEESAVLQTRSATQEYERLSLQVFPDLRSGLLHGRMPAVEKESILNAFRRSELDILVATTVIEVGIDIPNATVMIIEGADRFGLAQMHQLRGRVGRGADQSYCLLLSDDPSPPAQERLRLLEVTSDGFALAEADLRLRGPGDYYGTRQSGLPEFLAADFSDVGLIETARHEARRLLEDDPELKHQEHAALAASVEKARSAISGEIS